MGEIKKNFFIINPFFNFKKLLNITMFFKFSYFLCVKKKKWFFKEVLKVKNFFRNILLIFYLQLLLQTHLMFLTH
jgi:hypothetical protein